MRTVEVSTRPGVNPPARVSQRIRDLAEAKGLSVSKVMADLVESGLAAKEREGDVFFDVAEQLARSTSRSEQLRLKAELARLTFGR